MQNNDSKNKYCCKICKRCFKKPCLLLRHEESHRKEKKFKCDECSKSFSQKASQRRHFLHIHRKERKHKCPQCSQTFAQKSNLLKHIKKTHSLVKNNALLQCPQCSCSFKRLNIYKRHIKMRHSNENLNNENELKWTFQDETPVEDPQELAQSVLKQLKYLQSQSSIENGSTSEVKDSGATMQIPQVHFNFSNEINSSKHITEKKCKQKSEKFLCEACGTGFDKLFNLNRHRLSHSHDRTYHCDLCDKAFKRKSHLEAHNQQHILHEKEGIISNLYSCGICDNLFDSMSQLDTHRRNNHSGTHDLHYMCSHCPAIFEKLSTFVKHKHVQAQTDPQELLTQVPHTKELSNDKILDHRRFYTTKSIGEIDVIESNCNKKNIEFLRDQLQRQLSNNKDNGDMCIEENTVTSINNSHVVIIDKNQAPVKYKFMELQMLMGSGKTKRNINVELIDKNMQMPNSKVCHFCQKEFNKPSDLKRHLPTHTKIRDFCCEICGKAFAVKSTLNEHKLTHQSSRQLCTCQVCGKQYASKKVLKIHLRLHTGERPFTCGQCNRTFRTSGHYISHFNSMHLEMNPLSTLQT